MLVARRVLIPLVALVLGVPATPAPAAPGAWSASWTTASAGRWRTPEPAGAAARLRAPAAAGRPRPHGGFVALDGPQISALDATTGTLYVTSDPGDVAVIDAARCTARRAGGCADAIVATVPAAGSGDIALDGTGTVYVSDPPAGTVSVIDGATCNAHVTSGCTGPLPRVTVGGVPVGLDLDPASRTLYVGHEEPFVSVVDTASCNRSTITGCGQVPAAIPTEPGPIFPTVDAPTGTLYVPEVSSADGPPGTMMAVVDARTCNATTRSGCGGPVAQVTLGPDPLGPLLAVVDAATHTVYVENSEDVTVSIVDGATCNAAVTSGCGRTPPSFKVGGAPNSNMVIDRGTLFVVNEGSDTISAVDIRRCHAGDTTGCAPRSPTIATGLGPFWITLDPASGTLYVPQHFPDGVAVYDARTCNARRRTACRREAPAFGVRHGTFSVAVDVAHHTLLVGGGGALALVDTRTCRAGRLAGCHSATGEVQMGPVLRDIGVDRATHTAYVTDSSNDRVVVLDTAACHAGHPAGCTPVATIATGAFPVALAVNARTHAVYTADINGGSVSVIDGRHCSAVDRSGCSSPASIVPVGDGPFGVAVDAATNGVYVSIFIGPGGVRLLDGAACEARSPACGPIADVAVGANPIGLAVDRSTHTLYVANQAFNDAPGSVSAVDLRHCTPADTSGCGDPSPAVPAGRGTWAIGVDPATHDVYTTNFGDASVSVIQGATCNATSHRGCDRIAPRVPIGDFSLDLALDLSTHTLYTSDAPELAVSVIDTRAPCRAPVRCLR